MTSAFNPTLFYAYKRSSDLLAIVRTARAMHPSRTATVVKCSTVKNYGSLARFDKVDDEQSILLLIDVSLLSITSYFRAKILVNI